MRLLLVLFLLSISLNIAAQQIKPGEYFSSGPTAPLKLVLKPDNSFDVVFISGKFEEENDTLVFNKNLKSIYPAPPYQLIQQEEISSNEIEIRVNLRNMYYYLNQLYVAFEYNDSTTEYQVLAELFDGMDELVDESLDAIISKKIKKPKKIYLIYDSYEENLPAIVFNTDLKKGYGLELRHSTLSLNDIYLQAFINAEGKIVLAERNQEVLVFEQTKPIEEKVNFVESSIQNVLRSDLKLDLSNEINFTEGDSNVKFEVENFQNLRKALDKTSESENKFLVVYFDETEQSEMRFESAITAYLNHGNSYYFYYEYDEKYDPFNFYKADKKEISKWYTGNEPVLLVFDKFNNLVYQQETTIDQKQSWFQWDSNFYKIIKKSSKYAVVDQNIKNQPTEEVLNALEYLADQYNYFEIEEWQLEDEIEEDEMYLYENPIELAQFNKQAYSLKSTQDDINKLWVKILAQHFNEPANIKIGKLCAKELKGEGFNQTLFKKSFENNDLKMQMFDYYIKNYDAFRKIEEKNIDDYSYFFQDLKPYILLFDLKNVVKEDQLMNLFFEKSALYYANDSVDFKEKVYFYSYSLVIMENQVHVFDKIDILYQEVLAVNPSVILALDQLYNKDQETLGWTYYKSILGELLNNAAWKIVQLDYLHAYLPTAIQWSEKSLELVPNFSYYLDTLGRLYYQNGQVQNAIAMMRKAIEHGPNINDENLDNYKLVLQKMINNESIEGYYPD
jgi:hypothetical protein